jgi:hypothetical protein
MAIFTLWKHPWQERLNEECRHEVFDAIFVLHECLFVDGDHLQKDLSITGNREVQDF